MVNKLHEKLMGEMGFTTEQQWRAFEKKMENVLTAVFYAHFLDNEYCKLGKYGEDAWWQWGRDVLGSETAYEVFDRWHGGCLCLSDAEFNGTLWDGYEEFLGHKEYWAD